jgi:hypothetical protein
MTVIASISRPQVGYDKMEKILNRISRPQVGYDNQRLVGYDNCFASNTA